MNRDSWKNSVMAEIANVPPIPLKDKGFNWAAHKHVIPLVGLVTVTG